MDFMAVRIVKEVDHMMAWTLDKLQGQKAED